MLRYCLALLAGAYALTKLMTSLLYEVAPTDPVTYVGVAAMLGGGFVNRFDNQGTYFTSTGGANEESYPGGASLAACEESCRGYVLNEDFNAGCNNFCNPLAGAAQSAGDQLQQVLSAVSRAAQFASHTDVVWPSGFAGLYGPPAHSVR